MSGPTCDPKTHPSTCACCEWRLTVELPELRSALAAEKERADKAEKELHAVNVMLKPSKPEMDCGHSTYWISNYGNCIACSLEAAEERVQKAEESLGNEAWQHAACLSIAEGQADDGKKIANMSLAMRAVLQLRRDYLRALHKFDGGNTPFVCAAHTQYACSGCTKDAEAQVASLTERLAVAERALEELAEEEDCCCLAHHYGNLCCLKEAGIRKMAEEALSLLRSPSSVAKGGK